MKISYKWLCEYLPFEPDAHELADVLTRVGLEVEHYEKYESVKGGLEGILIGKIKEVAGHPNADKLKLTKVDVGNGDLLNIVCGAPNVAEGQTVAVATVGTTIYPSGGEALKMKKAKIRGEESLGMICAEDELGLGESHAGIMVLPDELTAGMPAKDYFKPFEDWVYDIGLTPNRSDAMSHLGVAKDVCAYYNNRDGAEFKVKRPDIKTFNLNHRDLPLQVKVENTQACLRYSGLSLTNVKIASSPDWLQQKLNAVGVKPINNVVDITNFVLQECGQPLHAFDAGKIHNHQLVIKNLPEGTRFVTLDDKERKLSSADLMICDDEKGLCIAGVFGGLDSGVQEQTTNIFLESAVFDPATIRATSFRHLLRTDAATHFEKCVDISQTIYALERAAILICELTGAEIASDIIDIYPEPKQKREIKFSYNYLNKLSGKIYNKAKVQQILENLRFEILASDEDGLTLAVPFHAADVSIQADVVEEIMRIDGYDQVEIPQKISITPATSKQPEKASVRERIADYLSANGFREIFTNSITNSRYYNEVEQQSMVRMINNLSSELDVMRPEMLESGLTAIAYNLNRKNEDLLFYEIGKTYKKTSEAYLEREHLVLYACGKKTTQNWLYNSKDVDVYFLKGYINNICALLGINGLSFDFGKDSLALNINNIRLGNLETVPPAKLDIFGIKEKVLVADISFDVLFDRLSGQNICYEELTKYPAVRRDLALILDKTVTFEAVEKTARSVKSSILQDLDLFDVFESEKLGKDKKSYALSFIFQDKRKTLTDKEIDKMMQRLIQAFEKDLNAAVRK